MTCFCLLGVALNFSVDTSSLEEKKTPLSLSVAYTSLACAVRTWSMRTLFFLWVSLKSANLGRQGRGAEAGGGDTGTEGEGYREEGLG